MDTQTWTPLIRFDSLSHVVLQRGYVSSLWSCGVNENAQIRVHVAFWLYTCAELSSFSYLQMVGGGGKGFSCLLDLVVYIYWMVCSPTEQNATHKLATSTSIFSVLIARVVSQTTFFVVRDADYSSENVLKCACVPVFCVHITVRYRSRVIMNTNLQDGPVRS